MSTKKMREEFEAAYAERLIGTHGRSPDEVSTWLLRDDAGEYMHRLAKDAWWAWKASRAALVVELPSPSLCGESYDCYMAYHAEETLEALKAAGVRVKE